MAAKLTRHELRIIEQTKEQVMQDMERKKPSKWAAWRAILALALFFILLVLGINVILTALGGR